MIMKLCKAWIAKDDNELIYLYNTKPHKNQSIGCWECTNGGSCFKIPKNDISHNIKLQWEDDEPIEVELKIEKI